MRLLSRLAAAPALVVRVIISLAALVCVGAGVAAFAGGRVAVGENLPLAAVLLILVAAVTRRYGIALPGNGFSSYVVGVMLFAILDRGWAFAAVVAPFAMMVECRHRRWETMQPHEARETSWSLQAIAPSL